MKRVKIVVLMENTSCREDIICEHGLSIYIESGDAKILFDAGQTGAFAENAAALGVDLAAVDFAVLSHGHYDHGGGLAKFLEINKRAPVYLHRAAVDPHFNAAGKYIGLDQALMGSGRLVFTQAQWEIAPGITLDSCAYGELGDLVEDGGMTFEEAEIRKAEDFRHEQYLIIEEAGKRIVFSGCSHKGICGIAGWLRADVLVGGFHLMRVEAEDKLREAAEVLLGYDTVCYTGHCTGEKQFAYMKGIMGDRLLAISAGMTLEL